MKKYSFLFIFSVLLGFESPSQNLQEIKRIELSQIGSNPTVMRRDPSDIIRVDNIYYVWYTKRLLSDGVNLFPGDSDAGNGYHGEIWYATSKNGKDWEEKGLCLKKGDVGAWDEQSAFTPNILAWEGQYYLFYTGVPKPFTNAGNQVTKSAIGLAVSDKPDGPWKKLEEPILKCSNDPDDFDSMRVDDACLVVYKGKIYLYYKGRQWDNTPRNTKMGLAVAESPQGPFIKNPANPLINAGHEVMLWPYMGGVMAMINMGPEELRRSIHYSKNGVDFQIQNKLEEMPNAGGFYRPEAFTNSDKGKLPKWGIEIVKDEGNLPGLGRFSLKWK